MFTAFRQAAYTCLLLWQHSWLMVAIFLQQNKLLVSLSELDMTAYGGIKSTSRSLFEERHL